MYQSQNTVKPEINKRLKATQTRISQRFPNPENFTKIPNPKPGYSGLVGLSATRNVLF